MAKKRYGQWSDLELGLGQFTKQLKSIEELRIVCFDINVSLKSFINGTYNNRIAELKKQDLTPALIKYLIHPEEVFNARTQGNIKRFFDLFSNTTDVLDIITFNYTNTIEVLLKLDTNPNSFVIGKKSNTLPIKYRSINHIHGILSDTDIILGVNDISQIANEDLRSLDMTSFLMVKPSITEQRGNLIDDKCQQLISNATVICLYGLSIGETDNKWWGFISHRLRTNSACIILYYAYDNNQYIHEADIFNHQADLKRSLLDKLDLTNMAGAEERVFVTYKSRMFDLI